MTLHDRWLLKGTTDSVASSIHETADAAGRMHGFQLWANLPAVLKMTAPRYQEIKAAGIPVVTDDDGTEARIICGTFWARKVRWMG